MENSEPKKFPFFKYNKEAAKAASAKGNSSPKRRKVKEKAEYSVQDLENIKRELEEVLFKMKSQHSFIKEVKRKLDIKDIEYTEIEMNLTETKLTTLIEQFIKLERFVIGINTKQTEILQILNRYGLK